MQQKGKKHKKECIENESMNDALKDNIIQVKEHKVRLIKKY